MRNHVWRPLFVVIGIVALLLGVRSFLVPDDFGIGERGYMYGFHRQGNEAEWKAQPVKYRAPDAAADCGGCHEQAGTLVASPHALVPCQNCHGPALEHPENPPALVIDRERTLCLRCHAALPYPESGRGSVPGIDPEEHNPGIRCVECHNPHAPSLEEVQP